MHYTIKPMETEAEMDGKGYVHWKSWLETYTGLIDPAYLQEKHTPEKCIQIAHRWPDRILIAKDGEKVIGFAGYGDSQDDANPESGEIFALYVLREYQGQGVGKALMNAALNQLNRYEQIALWVLAGNEHAIRFYERFGFRADGLSHEMIIGTPVQEIRMCLSRSIKNG